jgi:hypothetical protein
MPISIQEALLSLNGDVLKGLAQKMDVLQKTMTRKAQFAEAVERELTTNLAGFVDKLSDVERLWLAESVHQGRCLDAPEFKAKFGQISPWVREDPFAYSHPPEIRLLEAVVHRIDYTMMELRSQLAAPLRSILPKPATIGVRTVAELPLGLHKCLGSDAKPLQVFEGDRVAPVELGRVLRLVQAGRIKVTDSTRRPTDASTRTIAEALVVPDFALEAPPGEERPWHDPEKAGAVRAHAWGVLVQQCGWTLMLTRRGKATN